MYRKAFFPFFLVLSVFVFAISSCGGGGGPGDIGDIGGDGGGDGGGTAPSAPSNVSASASDGQVSVSWTAVSDATSYNIYWSTSSGVTALSGTKITGATSPYTHSSLTNGTTYYYIVTAVNADGESSASSSASATPQAVVVQKVPDTGQTTSYTDTFGEDSDYSINPPSYTDNGDGTITDNVTGLMWQKCSAGQNDDASCSGTASTSYWYQASGTYDSTYNSNTTDLCGSLTTGGYSDWRLPGPKELAYISDYDTKFPAINTTYFPGTPDTVLAFYWSSTTVSDSASGVWIVSAADGAIIDRNAGASNGYTRCVRGEQAGLSLTDNGDGTVTDNGNGLMWQQYDDDTERTWEEAITYCEGLSLASYTDWRLPNVKEIKSKINYSDSYLSLILDTTYTSIISGYWSSTTLVSSGLAWTISTTLENKTNYNDVSCVRGGQ